MSLGTPHYPKNEQIENQGAILFQSKLPRHWLDQFVGGKNPGTDGSLEIYNQEGEHTGLYFKYQLKTTEKIKKNFCSIKKELIILCKINKIPIIIILSNLNDKKVYWEYINSYYIETRINKIKKTTRIKFQETKMVGENGFEEEIIKICEDHNKYIVEDKKSPLDPEEKIRLQEKVRDNLNKKFNLERKNTKAQQKSVKILATPDEQKNTSDKVLEKIKKEFPDSSDKCLKYLFYIYFFEPYRTSTRPPIFSKLDLSQDEENIFILSLSKIGLINEGAGMIVINRRERVKVLINDLLNKNVVDVQDLFEDE